MREIAEILLKLEAVKLQPKQPFKFTSGILSPIYIDNRLLISHLEGRNKILQGFKKLIEDKKISFDVVAGVATAGIPWAAWLSEIYKKPMVYVREKPKPHGRQNQIEGNFSKGQRIIVVEDHISTGGSSIGAVKALRETGGIVKYCIAITTYEFPKSKESFDNEECSLYTLTNFTEIISVAENLKYIKDKTEIMNWNQNPEEWAKNLKL